MEIKGLEWNSRNRNILENDDVFAWLDRLTCFYEFDPSNLDCLYFESTMESFRDRTMDKKEYTSLRKQMRAERSPYLRQKANEERQKRISSELVMDQLTYRLASCQ